MSDETSASAPPIIGLTLNFRDAERTLRCVDSLLNNGVAHVVIWDNSDDGGLSAGQLAERLAGKEKISLLVSPANVGFAAAVNRGMAWIRDQFGGVWVALINNDAEFLPAALATLSRALVDSPEAILACPDIDNGGRTTGLVYYQRWSGILSAKKIPGSAPHASGCALLIAPERIEQTLFDETFFMYGEDAELGWRMVRTGRKMVYVPEVLVCHEGSASSGTGSEFYETRMVAAHLLLAKRLATSYFDYALMIFGRCLTLTVRASLRAIRYRSGLPLRALLAGWKLFRGNDAMLARAKVADESDQLRVF